MRPGCQCDVSRSVLECRQSSNQILRAVVIKLFLDIETLPGEESLRGDIAAEIKPRSRCLRDVKATREIYRRMNFLQ